MRDLNLCGDRIRLNVLTADIISLLDTLSSRNIRIFNSIVKDEWELDFEITGADYSAVYAICEARGDLLHVRNRTGLGRFLTRLSRRPVLMAGIVILTFFLLYLPSRILFVEVKGNISVPDRAILAAAEEIGVGFWTSRRGIHNEYFKNELVRMVPDIQWACVNTRGCVAQITVRERPAVTDPTEADGVTRIVAVSDGIILSADAVSGNLLCKPGQAVVKGQTLISGYTDCGLSIRATGAQGEVFAQTRHEISLIHPGNGRKRSAEIRTETRVGLVIGKKHINLWKDSGNSDSTCGRMYQEYYIILPGGFRLPVAVTVDRVIFYQLEDAHSVSAETMAEYAGNYLLSSLISGRILHQQILEEREDASVRMHCVFLCTEMIGRVQAEEIGEFHG